MFSSRFWSALRAAASVDDGDAESQQRGGLNGIERAAAPQDNGHYDDTKENPSDEEGDPDEPIPEPLQLPESTHTLFFTQPVGSIPFLFALGIAAISVTSLAMALFNGASCVEYFGMVREMNKELPYPPPEWCINLCVAACASLPVLLHATGGKMTSIIVATVISFTAICAALIVNEESHFNEFTSSLFGLIYCGFLPTFWVKLRGMSGVSLATPDSLLHHWPAWLGGPGIWTLGLAATITIVLSVVSADVGAYAFGKNFGKNKLTAVSPNKTVEGAIGGLLACAGTCAALFSVMGWPGTAWQGAFLGVTVFFTSVFGDLLESVMKRNATMKDSGNLIPGHGGLLDRFDSYIFTGSVTYFFVIAVLGGFRRVFSVGYY